MYFSSLLKILSIPINMIYKIIIYFDIIENKERTSENFQVPKRRIDIHVDKSDVEDCSRAIEEKEEEDEKDKRDERKVGTINKNVEK